VSITGRHRQSHEASDLMSWTHTLHHTTSAEVSLAGPCQRPTRNWRMAWAVKLRGPPNDANEFENEASKILNQSRNMLLWCK
jgi:hypothetical protein